MITKKRIKIGILVGCIIISLFIIIFYLADNTIRFTGEIHAINYENNTADLFDPITNEEFTAVIPEDLLYSIDIGCTLNVYWSGRVVIVGECNCTWLEV